MLQTRAGHCPKCDALLPSGVDHCPECGFNLQWDKTNDELRSQSARPKPAAAAAKPRPANPVATAPAPARAFFRLFILFIVACVVTMAAVSFRSRVGNQTASPELESAHAINVQDAFEFHTQVNNNKSNPDAPETNYVIGIAMPNGKDVIEITVRKDWKSLDYSTRLHYASKLVERWKAIHAPHRANMSILDEAGKEIGGRTWTGTVWVQQDHPDAPPSTKPAKTEGTPQPDATPEEGAPANQDGANANAASGESGEAPATNSATGESEKSEGEKTGEEKTETSKADETGTPAPSETPAATATPAGPEAAPIPESA